MNLFRHKQDSIDGVPVGHTAGELGRSQFGTPLDQIIHADTACDPEKWIIVPGRWGRRWKDPQEWSSVVVPVFWGAWGETNPEADRPSPEVVSVTAVKLAALGEKFGGFDPNRPFEIRTYLYLPDPHFSAIPTRVWVDDRSDLTPEEGAGIDDPDAIDNPTVEQFSTDALGTGLKVTRHGTLDRPRDDIEGTGIFVAVRYAFAVPNRQAVVTVSVSTNDLARMAAAQADLDEFVRTITLTLADGSPVAGGKNPGG
jgi:hypothetical protein